MARSGRWTVAQLEAAIDGALTGASFKTVERLTGVPAATVRDHVVKNGYLRESVPRPGRRRAGEPAVPEAPAAAIVAASGPCPPPERASTTAGYPRAHGVAMGTERHRRDNALSQDDREEIRVGIEAGESDAVIAERIGRHRSTVWREIAANGGRRRYRAGQAEERASRSARRPKVWWTEERAWLWDEVQGLLRTKKWSPEQIARRLRKEHPHQQEWWVSHEAIYQAIFVQAKPELRKELAACLRSGRARRRPRTRASSGRGQIVGMVNISERPAEVEDRAVPGHWEGDLLCGSKNSYIVTLVERHSRYVMLAKVPNRETQTVVDALIRQARKLPDELYRSLTWDRGKELTDHKRFSMETDIDVYFCDPQSPWQRGSSENTNRLLRQYFPKGLDLAAHSQAELNKVARQLNERPRKTLDFQSPAERFSQCVALIS